LKRRGLPGNNIHKTQNPEGLPAGTNSPIL
jgi:hypothetical protein